MGWSVRQIGLGQVCQVYGVRSKQAIATASHLLFNHLSDFCLFGLRTRSIKACLVSRHASNRHSRHR